MTDLLNQINRVPGVLTACFVDRMGGFSGPPGQREMSREKVIRALRVLSESLDAMGEGAKARTKRVVINTPTYRLLVQNFPEGTVCALCSSATDLEVLRKSLEPASALPKPSAPAPSSLKPAVRESKPVSAPRPVPVPASEEKPVPASILDEIYRICEEELGDLASTIFENREKDTNIRDGILSRERVLKFCLALQKDAGMIIGPKASKAMADRMLEKLA